MTTCPFARRFDHVTLNMTAEVSPQRIRHRDSGAASAMHTRPTKEDMLARCAAAGSGCHPSLPVPVLAPPSARRQKLSASRALVERALLAHARRLHCLIAQSCSAMHTWSMSAMCGCLVARVQLASHLQVARPHRTGCFMEGCPRAAVPCVRPHLCCRLERCCVVWHQLHGHKLLFCDRNLFRVSAARSTDSRPSRASASSARSVHQISPMAYSHVL